MIKFLKGNKWLLLSTILFSLLANIALVFTTKQYEWFFDVVASGDSSKFVGLTVFSISYILVVAILFYIYLLCSKKLIRQVLLQLREKIFCGIMKKNMKSYYEQNTSEYISVLSNDINLLEDNWLKPMLSISENIGVFVTTVVMLVYYSPLITVAIFVTSAVAFLVPSIMGKHLSKRQQNLSNQLSAFTNKVKNIFSGFDVIHSFNMLSHINKNFVMYNEQLAKRKYETDHFKVINDVIAQGLGITIQVLTSCLSAYLVLNGQISVGILAAVIQLCNHFVSPLMSIMNSLSLIKSMKPIINKFENLSKCPKTISGKKPYFKKAINVSNLSFSYDQHPVLDNINLEISPTKKYAIMGESGCGKTTLIKLLLGYYSSFQGTIEYDNTNISDIDLTKLNEMVSIIQQNVYMFDETIRYNICLQQDYSKESFDQALKDSGSHKILNADLSVESQVGENGSNLSGGQRQRIAIARALIRKTPILVLDEGTSAVDMQSAYEIEDNLLDIKELTLLSILHKTNENILKRYDEIIYMHKGQIIEKGSFDELIDSKGAFYNFYTITDS